MRIDFYELVLKIILAKKHKQLIDHSMLKEKMKTKPQFLMWIGLVIGVIITGIYYIPKEYPASGFWESLYTILRMFVFERDLAVFPKTWPLIIIHFLAPLLTISAIGTLISYFLLRVPLFKFMFMRDHVIICGAGKTGKLLAEALRKSGVKVVCIDSGSPEQFMEWAGKHSVKMIYGDFHSKLLLKKAGIYQVRSIIFASGNDLANIEGAFGAYELLKEQPGMFRLVWTHVADDRLAETMRASVRTGYGISIRIFDSFQIAADAVLGNYMTESLLKRIKQIHIIGFGKFGTDLFEVLALNPATPTKVSFAIIDKNDYANKVRRMTELLGMSRKVSFVRKDVQDYEIKDGRNSLFFLCTDDDLGNLSLALLLSKRVNTNIYVRMSQWPMQSVSEHLGVEKGIVFININELIYNQVVAMPGIFRPAEEQDLKRVKKIIK